MSSVAPDRPATPRGWAANAVLGADPGGWVCLARGRDGQFLAVKLLRPACDSCPDPGPLLLGDAQAMRRVPVTSPHLARVLDVGMDAGMVWLARTTSTARRTLRR